MTSSGFARVASIALTLIAVNSVGGTARAHPEFNPLTINRYVKFDLLSGDELRLAYTVLFGAAPAEAARREFDANHDGRLDDAETRALGESLKKEVLGGLALTVDGARVVPAFAPPAVGLAGAEVAPSPLSVDLIARIPLSAAREHLVHFDDATPFPSLGETELRVEESPATRLVSSHLGAGESAGKQSRCLFRGPNFSALEDRSSTVRVRAAPPAAIPIARVQTRPPRARRFYLYVVLGAVLLLGAGLLLTRRRS
jgi:hypothetical protein